MTDTTPNRNTQPPDDVAGLSQQQHAKTESLPAQAVQSAGAGRRVWLVTITATLVLALSGYGLTGRPDALDGSVASRAAAAHPAGEDGQPTAEQIAEMVQRLADRMKERPDDAQGWTMLARSYLVMGRLDEALQASERVLKLKPNDAQALADHADVLGVHAGRSLEGEPMKLIERALKIDPSNLKALALAGTAAFDRGEGAEAARFWDRVVQLGPADSPLVEQARESAAEARKMMAARSGGGATISTSSPSGNGVSSAAQPPKQSVVADANQRPSSTPVQPVTGAVAGPTVSGTVTLSTALKAQARPEDTVFIFARNAEGGRMPLAILRKQVKDLPAAFTLDDSLAMGPGMGLSSAQKVIVGARISRSGQAMPQSGDLEGVSAPVALGSQAVVVEISRALP
jgi:cytochrome c-type biogenesis protein CcmH